MAELPAVPDRRRVLVSGLASDAHTWNLVFLQLLLEEHGYEVVNLGPCVPDDVLVTQCLRLRPGLVVLSSVNGHGYQDALRVIPKLRDHPALAELPMVVGGKLAVSDEDASDRAALLAKAGFDAVFPDGGTGLAEFRRYVRSIGPGPAAGGDFGAFVHTAARRGHLVVQPRMGFDNPRQMRAGLAATKAADAATVGTITLDSYTRVGDLAAVSAALESGTALNGYPIVSHDPSVTEQVLAGICDETFPVQVRHGSAAPAAIFSALTALGLDATEGGPVSYCLPYGRTPLAESVRAWAECTASFAALRTSGSEPHLETFGGCMMGQLCPPGLLVALSVLEGLFFAQHGMRSISLSYAQQTHAKQDAEAVLALRRLCAELLPEPVAWHIVIYAYMGVYPASREGAYRLLRKAAELAVGTGSERLIVKTVAESRRIPTIEENVAALEFAAAVARRTAPAPTRERGAEADSQTYREARALIEAVLGLGDDVGQALLAAFARGYLDVPYCVHPDNAGAARSYIDAQGRLRWAQTGSMPLDGLVTVGGEPRRVTSSGLLSDLSYVRRGYDLYQESAPLSAADPGV